MEGTFKKTRVNIDGFYSIDVSVNETKRTVVAELAAGDAEPVFIYAERFDSPCNYLRTAIKKGITYSNGSSGDAAGEKKKRTDSELLNGCVSDVIM